MDLMMDMGMGQEMNTSMRVSPTLIAVNQILALSSMELQTLIQDEIEQNPALELSEKATCTVCGDPMRNGYCINCKRYAQTSPTQGDNSMSDFSGYQEYDDYSMGSGGGNASNNEEFDPMTLVAAEANVLERLYYDLRATLPGEDLPIAEYLIGSLDDKGFLSASVVEISRVFETTPERVEEVLHQLQRLGPPGLGARDVRECLMLQIEYIAELGADAAENVVAVPRLAHQIVDKYLTELGEHKYGFIAQKLAVSNDEVGKAREFIKEHLSPYPVMDGGEIQTWGSRSRAQYVQPDVRIREDEGGRLSMEVIESQRFYLKLNPIYQQLTSDMKVQKASFSDDDKKHIHQYVSRARLFISNINQRRETMGKIARCLLDCQEEFIRRGVRVLRPLTRAQVAEMTGLHESTVSRATAGKFVMLPSRQVIPFSDFFTASLSVKDVIKEIIVKEAAQGKPLTDREIVSRLKKEGIRVARRTVAKYRSQLGILPSTLR